MRNNISTKWIGVAAVAVAALTWSGYRLWADEAPPAPSAEAAPATVQQLPAGAQITALEVQPTKVELGRRYAYAQLLVSARLASGDVVDVTRNVQVAAPAIVQVSPTGVVRPLADGAGEIMLSLAGQQLAVPVQVAGQSEQPAVSFVQDVMPTMSKLGCNQGTCHGSLNGKNGFKLSLRGYDPLYDHRALTDDISGRRFNRAAPDQSLMLLKPAGVAPHVGGVLMSPGEPYYEILRAWIAGGSQLDLQTPRVAKIELAPQNPVVPLPGMQQQMKVLATYSDGSVRDVTLEAFVESGNTEVATHDKLALITTIRRGEAPVLARYEGAYAATTVTVMGDRAGYQWQEVPANNYVDELVYEKLKRVKTLPSELCTDDEFLRRVMLDLTGLPPTADQVRAFLADTRDTRVKRDELVDQLIGSPDYIEHWTNKWADLLQVNRKFLGEQGSAKLRAWIRNAVAKNMPYDKFVYTILTASGSNLENPPSAYFKVLRDAETTMENTTQLFLAVRFNCNKCHDHPFERWTQSQYYHLSAYFAHVNRTPDSTGGDQKLGGSDVDGAKPLVEFIADSSTAEVMHLGTGKPAEPVFPYGQADESLAAAPRRQRLATWLTSADNQYFAKSYVNRLWGYLFGLGIIDPIDDIRAGNPPTNPELLDRLTQDFVASGFDMQQVLRTICKSRTYQMSLVSNPWNADDSINYSHAIARRLPAEVLYDAIYRATGTRTNLPGMPAGARAAQLTDAGMTLPDGFFEAFGRPARESACECERSSGVMLGPVMALINGPTVSNAINDGNNAISKLVTEQPSDEEVIKELYLRILNRPATSAEVSQALQAFRGVEPDHVQLVAALAEREQQLAPGQVAWETQFKPATWTPLALVSGSSSLGNTFTAQPDGSIFVEGALDKGAYNLVLRTDLTDVTAIQVEALADDRLPSKGPGRAPNGNFVLSELKLSAAPADAAASAVDVILLSSGASFSQENYPVSAAIDGNPATGWAVSPQFGQSHTAVFETQTAMGYSGGTLLNVTLDFQFTDGKHALGRFKISATQQPRPLATADIPAEIQAVLTKPAAERTPDEALRVARHYFEQDAAWRQLSSAVQVSTQQMQNPRLTAAQDLAWALLNSPAFLFNR